MMSSYFMIRIGTMIHVEHYYFFSDHINVYNIDILKPKKKGIPEHAHSIQTSEGVSSWYLNSYILSISCDH